MSYIAGLDELTDEQIERGALNELRPCGSHELNCVHELCLRRMNCPTGIIGAIQFTQALRRIHDAKHQFMTAKPSIHHYSERI